MLAPREPAGAHAIAFALRESDVAIAHAIDVLSRTDVQAETGLTPELFLTLEAGWTAPEARAVVKAERALRAMPLTKANFRAGKLSWSQVRAIVSSVRTVDVHGRAEIDAFVGRHATDEPDELLQRIDDEVADRRADLAIAREDRAIERSFLSVQPHLDGSATLYGETDAESTAIIVEALDAIAAHPVDPDVEDAPSRARQRMDAFIHMCETTLKGGPNGGHIGRPRPRFLATLDLDTFAEQGRAQSARILASVSGRPARVTPVATETMLCDATIQPVVFDGARPIAIGDATSPISAKLRTALAARDGGCRFPGCGAPVAWCDAHHICARLNHGPTEIDNLLLLCRRCHRRVHRFRWRISLRDDGTIEFTRQGRGYSSTPRARTLSRT
ncbi:MAG TPA: DUF222 domain-containing protein [Actinomycetota bacterium]|nr:DUF222 domain-containing protein [Actinomycetota bacterium]